MIPSYFLFESFLNFIGIILEVGSSLLTQVFNTYNNSDNNRSNPLKLKVFLSNETP